MRCAACATRWSDDLVTRAGYGVVPTPYALSIWPAVREALAEPARRDRAGRLRSGDVARHLRAGDGRRDGGDADSAVAEPTRKRGTPGVDAGPAADHPGSASVAGRQRNTDGSRVFPGRHRGDHARRDAGGHPGHLRTRTALQRSVCLRDAPGSPVGGRPITLDDYCNAHHLLVSFSGRPFGFVDEALAAIKRSRRIVLTVNQFFTAGQVVANSDCLLILPRDFLPSTGIEDRLAWQPLPVQVPDLRVDMLWHRRQQTSPAHTWLRQAVTRLAEVSFVRKVRTARYAGQPADG